MFPLLDFLLAQTPAVYPSSELESAKWELLAQTKQIAAIQAYIKRCPGAKNAPSAAALKEKTSEIMTAQSSFERDAAPLLTLLASPDLVQLQQDKQVTFAAVSSKYNITSAHVDALYQVAKLQYDSGNYTTSLPMLQLVRQLASSTSASLFPALWGTLACTILTTKWDAAMQAFRELVDAIEKKSVSAPLEQLQQRSWLLHWSLFIWSQTPNVEDRDAICDLMFTPRYLEAIQTNAPWLCRYAIVAALVHKRRRQLMKILVKLLKQEGSDTHQPTPLIRLMDSLTRTFDFEAAATALTECTRVFQLDYFLSRRTTDFLEAARGLILETYARLHSRVSVSSMASTLGLPEGAAGTTAWMLQCLSEAKVTATFEAENKTLVLNPGVSSVHSQVVDKTRELVRRTESLNATLTRMAGTMED